MAERDVRPSAFRESWPLLALRYALVAAGVVAWLWEAEASATFVAGSVLFSVALALDLGVHGDGASRPRILGAAAQGGLALAALAVHPGVPAAVLLAPFLTGAAGVAPLPLAAGLGVACALATVLRVEAPFSVHAGLVALYGLAAALGCMFRLRADERRRHAQTVARLQEAQERLAAFSETVRDLSVAEERQRMAEELHDTLGHALVGTLLQLQVVRQLLDKDPAQAAARLGFAEDSLRSTLEQVRRALRSGPRRRNQLPLPLALETLAADFSAAGGPRVELVLRPDPDSVADVSPEVADVLYRTAREALTNAVRHGRATRVRITAEAVGARLFLRVADNGIGAADYTPGMGMAGMVQRVQALGGTLRFETAAGAGFTVEVGIKRRESGVDRARPQWREAGPR